MWRLRPALPTFTFWCSALPRVPTVAVARGLAAVGVAPAALLQPFDQGLLGARPRQLAEIGVGDEAATGARGLGLADRHRLGLQSLQALEHGDRVSGANLHDRLAP